MSKFGELRERLEKLPQLMNERNLSAKFGVFTEKVKESKDKLSDSYRDMEYISKVFPGVDCKKKILPVLESSVKEAKKLHKMIEEDPQSVQEEVTEKSIVRLRDFANSTSLKSRDIWTNEITNSVTKWEKLAVVIKDLGAKGGQDFKQAVESLKDQNIPQNDEEVLQIKNAQRDLQKGVANLGLEGPFGKFLETSAERGASPRELLRTEIKEKMDEFNLWDSFKIRLGR